MKTYNPFAPPPADKLPTRHKHAVVIGGSIAGLLAARVLADHADRITIVERDRLPADPAFRPGVPQMRHVHFLLVRGRQILETLFPGLCEELTAAGGHIVDWGTDLKSYGPNGWALRFESDLRTVSVSRELLEWAIRRRVLQHPRIRVQEASQVTDLVFDPQGTRVTGVQLSARSGEPGTAAASTTLAADLVVDASGRHSRAPRWLAAHGYEEPTETVIDSGIGYATRYYELDPSLQPTWRGISIYTFTYGAGMLSLEQGRWICTVTSLDNEALPTDEAAFLSAIRSLSEPHIYEALKHAQPISPVYGYRRTENRWRHYERLSRQPDNFLVLGDAVCALNPTYGQGMTSAALGALTLDRCLRQQRKRQRHGHRSGLAARFQRQLARTLRAPWLMATSVDAAAARSTTDAGLMSRLAHAYIHQMYLMTRKNSRVALARYRVMHLVAPPSSLLYPSVAVPVLGNWLRGMVASLGNISKWRKGASQKLA
jgi:2-polyprenyl-6-methoxyphenol hydroxylase-like FAD-dependent oxidoreductase